MLLSLCVRPLEKQSLPYRVKLIAMAGPRDLSAVVRVH